MKQYLLAIAALFTSVALFNYGFNDATVTAMAVTAGRTGFSQ